MAPSHNAAAFYPHFSPWLADSEQLARTLVGHGGIVRDLLARLQAIDQGGTANHVLLVGPRGVGKTHVLSLVERYVSGRLQIPADWTGPSKAWVCAFFTEEEHAGQNSLANLLLTLFAKLAETLPFEPLWDLPPRLSGETDQTVIDCCLERIQRFHAEKNKRVLLVLDNLQKILEQWPEDDHQRLRSFLSHNSSLVILGSAPSVFRAVIDQKAAFHDFFEIRVLTELNSEQVLELLSHRFEEDGRQDEFAARREELSKKLPAFELLTGGNPRLVLFLYQIATRSAFLDIESALRELLEQVREYFVSRLMELPEQPRKVLDTMAQMSGPATPKEIAEAARLRLPLVNGQLKRLKEGYYVRPIKLQRQKSTRYDITERLFRIWRQTASVAGQQRFRFLTDFLKLYYTPDEIRGLCIHGRGDLLVLGGRFTDALADLDAAPELKPGNWDYQADRLVALGCLGQHGPLMEALPAALGRVDIPVKAGPTVCEFMFDVAMNCLRRDQSQIALGLFAATLGMESWHASEWFRNQAGSFLRRVLDVKPEMYQSFVGLLAEKVKDANVLELLKPFLKANDFLQTGDLVILERLFPEVRELVLDIIRRIAPARYEELRRLM